MQRPSASSPPAELAIPIQTDDAGLWAAAPIEVEGRQLTVRTSIGIGVTRDGGRNNLLRDADLALYRANVAGDPGWALLQPKIQAVAV